MIEKWANTKVRKRGSFSYESNIDSKKKLK